MNTQKEGIYGVILNNLVQPILIEPHMILVTLHN